MRKAKRKENRRARNHLRAQKLHSNTGTGEGLDTSRNIWKAVYKQWDDIDVSKIQL
jgi:hypothetical protein